MVFTIKYRAFRLKFSHHPILWTSYSRGEPVTAMAWRRLIGSCRSGLHGWTRGICLDCELTIWRKLLKYSYPLVNIQKTMENHRKMEVYPLVNIQKAIEMAIYGGFSHEKWWFSMAMLNYQRLPQTIGFLPVLPSYPNTNGWFSGNPKWNETSIYDRISPEYAKLSSCTPLVGVRCV